MPKESDAPKGSPWEEEGRRQAYSVDDCAFVLVLGDKPAAAAQVALGIARVQSMRRPVYVADAVGLLPPIDDLVPFEWAHGIADVIMHGMALDDASHPLDSGRRLNILSSGATKLELAELMANERWMQVTEELRQKDALMLIVVPADEPAVQFLVPEAYGSILVGRVRSPTGVTALASISGTAPGAAVAAVSASAPRASAAIRPSAAIRSSTATRPSTTNDLDALLAAAAEARPHAVRRVTGLYSYGDEPAKPKKTRVWLVGACVLLLLLEFAIWYSRQGRPPAGEEGQDSTTTSQQSTVNSQQ